ncbi:hypothetical protein CVT25_002349 [Psilocybe cyanescens]|uniref:Uncharacterized protein n=1 Tax=Psilocybe cyanescens TaxID=93625 RepID=A0A409WKU4_PSICY|nr:hypothetical protein CVT25_002349 [Psilocybe cyanescens]
MGYEPVHSPSHTSRSGADNPDSAQQNPRESSPHGCNDSTRETQSQIAARPNQQSHTELERVLDDIVDQFRDGSMLRTTAVSQILEALDHVVPALHTQEKGQTLSHYLSKITANRSSKSTASPIRSRHQFRASDESVQRFLKNISSGRDDSRDDDERPRKTPKLSESDSEFPWYDLALPPSKAQHDASCNETCRLLRVYNKDIAKCKFSDKLSKFAPKGVPASQWEHIFRGDPLNLDHFLSALHRVTIDSESVGDTEISTGVAEPKRRIRTASDWGDAWDLASSAIALAFPHRERELRDYGRYINGIFAGEFASTHPRIILFDIAVRNEVGGDKAHCLRTEPALHNYELGPRWSLGSISSAAYAIADSTNLIFYHCSRPSNILQAVSELTFSDLQLSISDSRAAHHTHTHTSKLPTQQHTLTHSHIPDQHSHLAPKNPHKKTKGSKDI